MGGRRVIGSLLERSEVACLAGGRRAWPQSEIGSAHGKDRGTCPFVRREEIVPNSSSERVNSATVMVSSRPLTLNVPGFGSIAGERRRLASASSAYSIRGPFATRWIERRGRRSKRSVRRRMTTKSKR